jgi:hypothetical protein
VTFSWSDFWVLKVMVIWVCLLVCGQDRVGPLGEGKLLLGHAQQVRCFRGRPADRSQASGCGSRLLGQAVPGVGASARGGAEVGVDLAGDVALEAADDLGFGFPFRGAAFGVGAGGRVRAEAGEHDPPQRVVGLAVSAGVKAMPDGLAG